MNTKQSLPEFLKSFCQSHLVGCLLSKTQEMYQSESNYFFHWFLKAPIFQQNKIIGNHQFTF